MNIVKLEKKSKSISFLALPGDDVIINSFGIEAKVVAVYCAPGNHKEYKCIWWLSGARYESYLLEHEIEIVINEGRPSQP